MGVPNTVFGIPIWGSQSNLTYGVCLFRFSGWLKLELFAGLRLLPSRISRAGTLLTVLQVSCSGHNGWAASRPQFRKKRNLSQPMDVGDLKRICHHCTGTLRSDRRTLSSKYPAGREDAPKKPKVKRVDDPFWLFDDVWQATRQVANEETGGIQAVSTDYWKKPQYTVYQVFVRCLCRLSMARGRRPH
jgi:hypothetical protein